MATRSVRKQLLPALTEELSEIFLRITVPAARRKALDSYLTDSELRTIFDGEKRDRIHVENRLSSKRILQVIAEHRNWSMERSLLELAFGLDLIAPGKFKMLRRAIGEPVEELSSATSVRLPSLKPRWSASEGQLLLGDDVIREVRILRTPSRVQQLMEAFEEAGWTFAIKNPFKDRSQETLHRFLNEVNSGLEKIRFHGRAGGREITWTFVTGV